MRLAMWSIKKKMYNCKIAEMRCVCPGSVPTTFSMVVNDSIIRIYPGLLEFTRVWFWFRVIVCSSYIEQMLNTL